MTDDPLLAANQLYRSYGRIEALKGIDLELHRGEILGFLGLNGAGKSTTMQILAGALAPDRGEVRICGHDLARAPAAARRRLGFLPQTPPLYEDMRVDEYLGLCARIHGLDAAANGETVSRARARCGLAQVGACLIRHLSGGYRQRVGLAQALLHEPDVLILDEPTAGLDPAQIRDVHELLRDYGREHAVIMSTHILPEVQALATRVIIVHQGHLVHDATLDTSRVMRIRFVNAPDAAELLALDDVRAASRDEDGCWLLETNANATAALAAHAVQAGWGVLELDPAFDALERVFLRLTSVPMTAARA